MLRALKQALGRVLNALGAPGFIRSSGCDARLGVPVEVRVDDLFTIVAVNNLRLMFNRLTGQFDGVVIDSSDCLTSRQGTGSPPYSAPTPR
jgi:hypothetical protein